MAPHNSAPGGSTCHALGRPPQDPCSVASPKSIVLALSTLSFMYFGQSTVERDGAPPLAALPVPPAAMLGADPSELEQPTTPNAIANMPHTDERNMSLL